MKILLLHEFSGLQTNLKYGLRELGLDAKIATFGDGVRAFETDLWLGPTGISAADAISRTARQLRLIPKFRSYDIIQTLSPLPFNRAIHEFISLAVLSAGGPRLVYVTAGSDPSYRRQMTTLRYHPPHYDSPSVVNRLRFKALLSRADALVSAAWEYDHTLRRDGYAPRFIPLPIRTSDYECTEIPRKGKLVVYHPLTRLDGNDFKGTSHIRKAFEALRPKFRRDVEFVERGGMSFEEYKEFTKSVHVLVDQAYSYSYGMAAVVGMAQGKVVMSGLEEATRQYEVYRQSPVINIEPDAEKIAAAIERALADRDALAERGFRGRQAAEAFHEATTVGRQYLEVFRAVMGRAPKSEGP